MSIKTYKPITPSLRHMIKIVKPAKQKYKMCPQSGPMNSTNLLTDEHVEIVSQEHETYSRRNKLILGRVKQTGGRNNSGRITVRHIGGGHKQKYRKIDYQRLIGRNNDAIVERIDYNPTSSGFLGLLHNINSKSHETEQKWYILAPEGLKKGDIIKGEWCALRNNEMSPQSGHINSGSASRIKSRNIGESTRLKDMEIGTEIYNLDGRLIRAAGTKGIILRHVYTIDGLDITQTIIKLPSGDRKSYDSNLKATIGQVSNQDHNKEIKGKAGVSRWLGIRPTVRGEAMNPVDHPHGGKNHGSGGLGNPQKTKWGKLAKWVPLNRRNKTAKRINMGQ